MPALTTLQDYEDENGNRVQYGGEASVDADIQIQGRNNTLVVAAGARLARLAVNFMGNNGVVRIGGSSGAVPTPMRFVIRVGHQSRVRIGEDVSCQGTVFVSAVEGARVRIGDDVMFAKGIEIRCDDVHPIFDVVTGKRVNPSESIHIQPHAWLAGEVTVLGGATVGAGSVIGKRSVVTRAIPNNCIAVGAPAKVVRRNVAWARPSVLTRMPGEVEPRQGEKERIAAHWNLTREPTIDDTSSRQRIARRLRRFVRARRGSARSRRG